MDLDGGATNMLTIWPKLVGEKAHYSFELYPSVDVDANEKIWVQFNPENYDYFVADTLYYLDGASDDEEEQLIEMTCLIKNKNDANYQTKT